MLAETVFWSHGKKYHRSGYCPHFENGRDLWGSEHTLVEQGPVTQAISKRKLPCLVCKPSLRVPASGDFGHVRSGDVCARCVVPWPCTSAQIMGLL